jgi:hypothetical protein
MSRNSEIRGKFGDTDGTLPRVSPSVPGFQGSQGEILQQRPSLLVPQALLPGGWPGFNDLESVDMEDVERISLQQFPWK